LTKFLIALPLTGH